MGSLFLTEVFLSIFFAIFCLEDRKNRQMDGQKGNGSTAAQTELQHVPRVYLTGAIITVIVEMKAQFSEAY